MGRFIHQIRRPCLQTVAAFPGGGDQRGSGGWTQCFCYGMGSQKKAPVVFSATFVGLGPTGLGRVHSGTRKAPPRAWGVGGLLVLDLQEG